MSYGAPQKRRAAGGGGLIFLIILAIGGYLLLSNLSQPPASDGGLDMNPGSHNADRIEDERQSDFEEVLAKEPLPPKKRADEGWDMTDVDVKNDPTKDPHSVGAVEKTQKGDWAIEEVKGTDNNGAGVKFGNQTGSSTSDPTKTTKGDWEIEEVKEKGGK